MSQTQAPARRILQTNCGRCGASIKIDVTDFEPNMSIPNIYSCQNGHAHTVLIRGGKILSIQPHPIVESDIDEFVDVPDHIRTLVKEAYRCSASDAPIAGACIVRRLLDELLYELGFTTRYLGEKVTDFESRANNDSSFRQTNDTICRRIPIFKTIANLAGYHAHAQQRPIVSVVKTEFEEYLHAVEGAIKDRWPNRRNA
jgi:hypothetical protein